MRPLPILAISGLVALVSVPGLAQGRTAVQVDRVQLAVADSGGASCPRDATLTAWAHTNGPGVVRFVIHNQGGGKTGELKADAVPGAAGTYLATYKHTFKVTTDVDTQYMAQVAGSGQESNWVPFTASCGPKPRDTSSARGSAGQPPARTASPPARAASESRARASTGTPSDGGSGAPPARTAPQSKPDPQDESGGNSKPNSGGSSKPNPSSSNDGKQCGRMITSTRVLAATRNGGVLSALAAWKLAAMSEYPSSWGQFDNAKDSSLGCKRVGLTFNCTASARPCEP